MKARVHALKAIEALVQGNWEGGQGLAMAKDSSGLWSVTTSELQVELWAYSFSVGGVPTLDPSNYTVARDGGWIHEHGAGAQLEVCGVTATAN